MLLNEMLKKYVLFIVLSVSIYFTKYIIGMKYKNVMLN